MDWSRAFLAPKTSTAKVPADKRPIQRQIDATDKQVDRLAQELYELTDEDIAIVEEAVHT